MYMYGEKGGCLQNKLKILTLTSIFYILILESDTNMTHGGEN